MAYAKDWADFARWCRMRVARHLNSSGFTSRPTRPRPSGSGCSRAIRCARVWPAVQRWTNDMSKSSFVMPAPRRPGITCVAGKGCQSHQGRWTLIYFLRRNPEPNATPAIPGGVSGPERAPPVPGPLEMRGMGGNCRQKTGSFHHRLWRVRTHLPATPNCGNF